MIFDSIDYLKKGNQRQMAAHHALATLRIFEVLKEYQPILTGTIPLAVDLPSSDLDIICSADDVESFQFRTQREFGHLNDFKVRKSQVSNAPCLVANFKHHDFDIELFCQSIPTKSQNAYLHMLVEHRLLSFAHKSARQEIRNLKAKGLKTEPAFAQLFHLAGDPYQALLDLAKASDQDLKEIASRWRPV